MDTSLEEQLQSIGKKTFVLCFTKALEKRGNITKEEVINCDPDSEGWREESVLTKTSKIKRIFTDKKEFDAFRICKNSKRSRMCEQSNIPDCEEKLRNIFGVFKLENE